MQEELVGAISLSIGLSVISCSVDGLRKAIAFASEACTSDDEAKQTAHTAINRAKVNLTRGQQDWLERAIVQIQQGEDCQ